jgi:hypothetical protein
VTPTNYDFRLPKIFKVCRSSPGRAKNDTQER